MSSTNRGSVHLVPDTNTNTRAPLTSYTTNHWSDEKPSYSISLNEGFDEEGNCVQASRDCMRARRIRRTGVVLIAFAFAVYFFWSAYLGPSLEEDWFHQQDFSYQENETYELTQGGNYAGGIKRVQKLDSNLLPGGHSDPKGTRRLIFVGDVHGCRTELRALLKETGFDQKTDHLVLVGDVISKGPDSPGVLDELIRLGATSVRGNHEDRVLLVAEEESRYTSQEFSAKLFSKKSKDVALLKELKPHHLDYVKEMPLILQIPALPLAATTAKKDSAIKEDILVVHGGLVPGVPLERQDPFFVMNMRSIHHRTHIPSADPPEDGHAMRPWISLWGWYNGRLSRGQSIKGMFDPGSLLRNPFTESKARKPQVVVYGHHASAGLQIKKWSKGLDSACVTGGELTAMVLDAWGNQRYYHIRCKTYHS